MTNWIEDGDVVVYFRDEYFADKDGDHQEQVSVKGSPQWWAWGIEISSSDGATRILYPWHRIDRVEILMFDADA